MITSYRACGANAARTKRVKVWVEKKYLCKASTRLSEGNARLLKMRNTWAWRGNEIDVNTITPADREKYGIPDNARLLAIVENLKTEDAASKREGTGCDNVDSEIDRVYHSMCEAKANMHTYYNRINEQYNVSKENCKLFAQRWAVWQWINENYNRSKNSLSVFHAAYNMAFPGHINDTNSFSNFKKACDLKGIENKVIDQRAITKVAKRITSFQHAMLQSLYIQPQKIQAPAAHRKLIEACEGIEQPYSLASVKNYFREFENNAELYAQRYGAGAAQKQLVYGSLLPAEHRNTQWQIDGWTMPFWGADFDRYVLYLIRDNHSRKIIGYSFALTENTALILEGLEDAMRNTGIFPGELVCDKHSFHKTEIAARLREETEKMGAVWTVTINAQRNQLAERYNQYLDALCKDFAGYTGKNMTATGKDARPAPEALEQYRKTANFKTAEEIKTIAVYVVKEFNKTPLTALNGLSPNEAYAASEDKKCFAISETERLMLIRPISPYKVTRGQIIIKVGMKKHEFQLPAALTARYNNRNVLAVWEDLTQGIYISDIKSGEELGCILPKRKIHGAIPDQTTEDREWLNQLTGRSKGITVKARNTAQEKIVQALKKNPEAIELINHYSLPKDIRAIAAQDNELKRAMAEQGINYNLIPIRQQKAAEVVIPAAMPGAKKVSPFAAAGNNIRPLDADEVF